MYANAINQKGLIINNKPHNIFYKMILVISQDYSEHSTDKIIDWIDHYKVDFERLNGIDLYKDVQIVLSNENIKLKVNTIKWKNINVVWFRRWISPQNSEPILLKGLDDADVPIHKYFNLYLREEFKIITSFFFDWIPKEKVFDKIFDNEINKLTVLKKASEFNLLIPETNIFTNIEILKKIYSKERLIVKSISNSPLIDVGTKTYVGYTEILKCIPKEISKNFAPSLTQTLIEKKYEIRTFLLDRTFYSMAIFSQQDGQTEVDFRRYNYQDPNRNVPFKLPISIEESLLKLADFFELNTCSFDLIKKNNGEYIFLEVNPGGQFGMVSYPCNYHLEKKLAIELIKRNNEYKTHTA